MKKFFISVLERITKTLKDEEEKIIYPLKEVRKEISQEPIKESSIEIQIIPSTPLKKMNKKPTSTSKKKTNCNSLEVVNDPRNIRDIMELMEVPFVALSKNRTKPILYESPDGKSKVRITCHAPYYVASIYDWDIILLVSSKLQEIMNSSSDMPPRTLVISRNELIKAIYRHVGKTTDNEIESALNRLKATLIETTIHNEDYRYKGGFSFLDSWGYTDRKDIKEFRITLSQWLYEVTCHKGSLLKVHTEYFKITSGLKRFLYRTARKHVGIQNKCWTFSIETLYQKSGSERELKKFKHDLKKVVKDNDIPDYSLNWVEKEGKSLIEFTNKEIKIKKIETK